jgi:hypothetical protein
VRRFLLVSAASISAVAITYFLPYGFWAEVGDLPAHPLIVHVVVVLLPLVSIFLIVGFFKKQWLENLHLLLIAGLAGITVSVLAARSSGNSLSAAVGLPEKHADWGNQLVPIAIALLGTFILYVFFTFYRESIVLSRVFTGLVGALAIASVVMAYLVGHSGAEASWKIKYEFSKMPLTTDYQKFSRDEVEQHDSKNDCWTIVRGNVYDVTTFVSRHPGGDSEIRDMCGTDASEDFLEEHSGQAEPEEWLARFKIGTLK